MPDRNTCQTSLDENFFHGRFPKAISFDDGCLERYPFQFRDLQFDFPCGSVKILLVMAGMVFLAVRGTHKFFIVD